MEASVRDPASIVAYIFDVVNEVREGTLVHLLLAVRRERGVVRVWTLVLRVSLRKRPPVPKQRRLCSLIFCSVE
jgi:hypothetical protein